MIFDAAVLFLNINQSYKLANDAHAIHLANRQESLLHKMHAGLLKAQNDIYTNSIDANSDFEELEIPYRQFDEVIDSFYYGASLIGLDQGNDQLLNEQDYRQANEQALIQMQSMWQQYRHIISLIAYSNYTMDLSNPYEVAQLKLKIEMALQMSDQYVGKLATLSTEFANSVESFAEQKTKDMRLLQQISIVLSILFLVFILFYAVRKMSKSDEVTKKVQKELVLILDTVDDGLFLLDEDNIIGNQYSKNSKKIIFENKDENDFVGHDFLELIKSQVSEQTLQEAESFLHVMFSQHAEVELLTQLNPLNKIQTQMYDAKTQNFVTRYLNFDFIPAKEKGRLKHLLVKVTDISKQIELESALKKIDESSNMDFQLLLSLLDSNSQDLFDFIKNIQNSLTKINSVLQNQDNDSFSLIRKLNEISAITHKVKGEATTINLPVFVAQIHDFEHIIVTLRDQKNIQANDLLPITVKLKQTREFSNKVLQLVKSLNGNDRIIQNENKISKVSAIDSAIYPFHPFENLASVVSKDMGKSLRLDLNEFNKKDIPNSIKEDVDQILTQLIRNSVCHGIESKSLRSALGKSFEGVIKITSKVEGNQLILSIKDDGQGINVMKIKARVLKSKLMDENTLSKISHKELIRYLFNPGFTTVDAQDTTHAGHGIGLYSVKHLINNLNGKLFLKFKPREYTEFKISINLDAKDNKELSNFFNISSEAV
ncbi:ATP-binding protein [Marinicellulosiphila megalodicopiae]|uniref:ATP-binding protein n=1 Tax=Marinicellulosiphila megalodicopiae TaxID=2724896 RepID=UPI003BAE6E5E